MVNTKWKFIIPLALLLIFGISTTAYAHGVKIDYTVNMTIDIVARYDTGEPMGGAQVVVYAPDDPSNPWLTGVCDDEGRFSFTPDTSKPGTWSIQVRKAGHGDIIHIPIGEDTGATGGSGGYTVLQIVLMAVCGIWGFVGTALYFSRRRV
jgi:nickel transport protein